MKKELPNEAIIRALLYNYAKKINSFDFTIKSLYELYPNKYMEEEVFFHYPELQEGLERYMSSLCANL